MGDIEDQEDLEEANPPNRSAKEEMLEALARYLSKKRLANITRMIAPGYSSPKSHNGAVPDIEAVTSMVGMPIFGLVEDCETYALASSTARLEALTRVSNAAVFIVVPKACYLSVRRKLNAQFAGRGIIVLPYGPKR